MKKHIKYIWLITFLTIAFAILLTTPKDIRSDARRNQNVFHSAIKFIDSFDAVNKRLPSKLEFNSWQRHTFDTVVNKTLNVCNDSINDLHGENLTWQYLRSKNDFDFGKRFQLNNINFCHEYAMATWNGDDRIFYLSWDIKYSNEYSWTQSVILSLFYSLLAFIPLLYKKYMIKSEGA